jgi:hypothetical protein
VATDDRDLTGRTRTDPLRLDLLHQRLDLLAPAGLIASSFSVFGGMTPPWTLEDGIDVAQTSGGRRFNGDAVAHTCPPEVVGPIEPRRLRARRDITQL